MRIRCKKLTTNHIPLHRVTMAADINFWFLTLFGAHIFAAFWCPILDCDEVFNYWEPLHHLLHGNGLQTWEYAGTYALRSYLYLVLHAPVPFLTKLLGYSKVFEFYGLRIAIACLTAACETHWLQSLEQRLGPRIKAWTHLFLLVSPGMFVSSAAFIPSSFSMSCLLLCQSFQLRRSLPGSIFCGAVAVVLGWPFCVVVLLPVGLDLVYEHGLFSCINWGVLSLMLTAIPTVAVDTFFYLPLSQHANRNAPSSSSSSLTSYPYVDDSVKLPRAVWSTFNLVVYNMFPTGTGSELYGIESWHFYLRNLTLNFNIALLFAFAFLAFMPLMILVSYTKSSPTISKATQELKLKQRSLCYQAIIWASPFFLWFTFLTMLPHKEERFMFVVYPQLCFAAACTCVIMETSFFTVDSRSPVFRLPPFGSVGPTALKMPYTAVFRNRCLFLAALVYMTLSFARTVGLVQYYNAPVQVYGWLGQHIQSEQEKAINKRVEGEEQRRRTRVCVGKEWYRFPSHFLLPNDTELMFVESGFKGELPRPFDPVYGSHAPWGGNLFNDLNQLQDGIFVDVATCDYVVDLQLSQGDDQVSDGLNDDFDDDKDTTRNVELSGDLLEPWFSQEAKSSTCQRDDGKNVCTAQGTGTKWKSIHNVRFLDAENTPTLARIFYIPLLVNVFLKQEAKYISYHVLRSSSPPPF